MTRNELIKLISEKEKQHKKNVESRSLKVLAMFTIVYSGLLYMNDRPESILDFLGLIVVGFILAFIHHLINGMIYFQIAKRNLREDNHLAELKIKLSKMDESNR